MSHFATTALIRKRAVKKRIENHFEKASRKHEKNIENSLRFLHALLIRFFMDSGLVLRSFSGKKIEKSLPEGILEFHIFFALIFS